MRPIDADALASNVMDASNADQALAMIDDAPTIDAVPVVRCRECVHREKCFKYCKPLYDPDWFCADGQRREDGDGDG